jgi:protein TonB
MQNMMKLWVFPSTMALIVSFVLFVFMANLIKRPTEKVPVTISEPIGGITFTERKSIETIQDPHTKPKPMEKSTPPPREIVNINQPTPETTTPVVFDPSMIGMTDLGHSGSDGIDNPIFKKPGDMMTDGDATPIVQVPPQYPLIAARQGIEGWVKLSFSIDKTGSVTNVQILESSPARMFDRAAKKALKKWRYKAKFVDGAPVIQDNLQVKLDFTDARKRVNSK